LNKEFSSPFIHQFYC